MAFEDRCSPQSAPSPPGIPHSPQNSTSPSAHHHHHHHNPQYFHNPSTFSNQSAPISPDMSMTYDRLSPMAAIKQEELTMDNQIQREPHQQQPIRFSISNILSDNFGKVPNKNKNDKKNGHLFRPYDIITRNENPAYSDALKQQAVFLEEMRLAQLRFASAAQHHHQHLQHAESAAAVLDFSRTSAPQPIHTAPSSENNKPHPQLLFNTFNASSYPKIHEEILNGKHHHHHHHRQFHSNAASGFSESSYAKIPPLGNLCKTVSQIGQPSSRGQACRSPSSSVSSSSSSTLSVTPVKNEKAKVAKKPQQPQQSPGAGGGDQSSDAVQPIPPPRDSSGMESSDDAKSETSSTKDDGTQLWPAWVYCTRYSDRPSSGPRYRKPKVPKDKSQMSDEKRPRTAFSSDQLARLKREFIENRYLTERRRQSLSAELGLNEAQIKIWFQNKRAKIKKTSGNKNPLALQLMAQGLYNHSTVPLTKEEEELEMRMNGQLPPQ